MRAALFVSFPDLPGCITCGETLEAAVANAADAKRAWLQAALEDGLPVREPDNLENYSGSVQAADSPKACIALWRSMRGQEGHQHESILCISAFQKRCRCPLMRTAAFLVCSRLRKRQNRLTSGTFALIILFWIMM